MGRVITVFLFILLAACSTTQKDKAHNAASADTFVVTCTGDVSFHQTPAVAKSNPIGLIGTGKMNCGQIGLMKINAIVREGTTMSIASPCHISFTMSPGDPYASNVANALLRGAGEATAVCADKVHAAGHTNALGYWGLFDQTNAKGSGYVTMKNEVGELFIFFFNLNRV